MAVGDIILAAKYDQIRAKVNAVVGVGSGASGYGQTLYSADVVTTNPITEQQWDYLRLDLQRAWLHQTGTTATTATVTNVGQGDTIFWAYAVQYDLMADNITTNKDLVYTGPSVGTYTSQLSLLSSTRTLASGWGRNVANARFARQSYNLTWSDANQARYFFNTGGYLRFIASSAGTALNTKDTSWQVLISTMTNALFTFDATKYRAGVAGTTTSWNYKQFSLTNPYSENSANFNFTYVNANTIQMNVTLDDADAGDQNNIGPAVDETINITIDCGVQVRTTNTSTSALNNPFIQNPTYSIPAWTLSAT